MIERVLQAAEQLGHEGIDAAVIDVATLKPLDMDAILSSLKTTGRCVIVHEAPLSGGWGAEIAARIADQGLMNLLAPVKRVTGFDTVMPLPKLEHHYIPHVGRILEAAREVLNYR
jgi:2-oxoisovalerate dehydrogenase E1 component beta subunit